MVQLLAGEKGSGKTKILLEKANAAAAAAKGNVVFVDKDNSHMYELKNTIRLVNISEYDVTGADGLSGFLAGLIAADHDLEEIFIDRLAVITDGEYEKVVNALVKLAEKNNVNCTASVSVAVDSIPESLKSLIAE